MTSGVRWSPVIAAGARDVSSTVPDIAAEQNGCIIYAGCPATVSRSRKRKRLDKLFLKWMENVVLYTNASQENRPMIVLDGNHSHKISLLCKTPENILY